MTNAQPQIQTKKRVLNVGGQSKDIPIPSAYNDWEHVLLDIDPETEPDILCDAKKMDELPANSFDSVYCSHNLEHYFDHEVLQVLKGFLHVLKEDGFAYIRVPNIQEVIKNTIERNLDIGDVLYTTPNGTPIRVKDVIYGYQKRIEVTGQPYYAHNTGFSPKSLEKMIFKSGFIKAGITTSEAINNARQEITCIAFKKIIPEETESFFNNAASNEKTK